METTIKLQEVLKNINVTIKIKGLLKARIRFKITSWLIRLGGWIAGSGVKVNKT